MARFFTFLALPTFVLWFDALFYPLLSPLPFRVVFRVRLPFFNGQGLVQALRGPLPHPFQEFGRWYFMVIKKNSNSAVHVISYIITLLSPRHRYLWGQTWSLMIQLLQLRYVHTPSSTVWVMRVGDDDHALVQDLSDLIRAQPH